ncbi:MAG: bifunctional UDP-N-acetylglucosamine diphosphorylase/glucosamine-1-phosphate N-acetyltransferase GlmU [Myxococcales bacterium]|nr:bifunctional UDP-N-acetylglucosamine diphosphorylase/glucosamine-1-phosphate N-acetyltransferase GlmU [Myxococcales bacterium]MDD9970814.1 bifunctional UDP-N-acetylglucosamine diphosphorylase/glucosamine-1-phosphate N-acetyltransferase GlmU [Myxococcales bacterium]
MSKTEFAAIVLAAGQGTRMKSQQPKVLHSLLGRPMVSYPVAASLAAGADRVVVVVGHGAGAVTAALTDRFGDRVTTALQTQQLGTGHAAQCGASALPRYDGYFLILPGDCPLITSEVLGALLDRARADDSDFAMITSSLPDATGYGRVIRNGVGRPVAIVEERDCTDSQRTITEFNPGIYVVKAEFFRQEIERLDTNNAQGELYLTDLLALASKSGTVSDVHMPSNGLHGINDRAQLVARERDLRMEIVHRHLGAGVTIRDPETTFIDADVTIEPDVTIESGVHLRGRCHVATGAHIDTGCVLTHVTVGANTSVLPYTVAAESQIGASARIGPFSHLRPGSELGDEVHMGNFVETKKTVMARGAKANHLAYLGDGIVGEKCNVGAGTIFCNYDGFNKHQTVLEDNVFVGSDSQLIAPVTVGRDAYVGSGSTVTQDVPAEALAIGRARQVNKPGLATRLRAKLKAERDRRKAAKSG